MYLHRYFRVKVYVICRDMQARKDTNTGHYKNIALYPRVPQSAPLSRSKYVFSLPLPFTSTKPRSSQQKSSSPQTKA